ncbi:hypothetical protein KI688_003402 [Linnemannia hyalina]|uniref:Transmembrane protein n=1 Tax=Linnemannia hyalina TaxID=64524 RepID=A0A9P7XQN2_9FUNG|nr:hypothetical protein KI688_003402 [Linnemannia hyalina]
MSSGSVPIPVYNQACLATDSTSTSLSFFLVGSSAPGSLEVNYVNNADAATVNRIATQNDQSAWTPNAAKLCYIYPFTTSANPGIKIVQFGSGSTFIALAQTNNVISGPNFFNMTGFTSSRYGMVNQPVDTDDAMLVVGTYGSYSGNTSQGYTIVFDKSSRGQIFSATGNLLANLTNFVPALALGMPTVVNMDGITLSPNAIPITMGSVAYILDMEANGTTAIYKINPSASSTLARVYKTGDSLPFSNNMAAAALNNQLLTYSVNKTGANINTFDLTTKTWSGSGLIKAATDPNPKTSVPLGAIIGGAVGGLLVIVLAIVLCIRCRRRPHPSVEKAAAGAGLTTLCPEMTKVYDGNQGLGYQQQQQVQYIPYDQGQVQYVQVQTPYDQGQGQGQVYYDSAYGRPSPFIPPLPPPQHPTSSQSPVAAYMTYQPIMEEAGGSSVASTTVHSSSYASPASYRNSAALLQGSPESTYVNFQRMSVTQHGPQFIPEGYFAGAETRSPQDRFIS